MQTGNAVAQDGCVWRRVKDAQRVCYDINADRHNRQTRSNHTRVSVFLLLPDCTSSLTCWTAAIVHYPYWFKTVAADSAGSVWLSCLWAVSKWKLNAFATDSSLFTVKYVHADIIMAVTSIQTWYLQAGVCFNTSTYCWINFIINKSFYTYIYLDINESIWGIIWNLNIWMNVSNGVQQISIVGLVSTWQNAKLITDISQATWLGRHEFRIHQAGIARCRTTTTTTTTSIPLPKTGICFRRRGVWSLKASSLVCTTCQVPCTDLKWKSNKRKVGKQAFVTKGQHYSERVH